MTYFSYFSLQTGLYSLFAGDSTLSGMIQGVYDHVPPDAAYPYIVIGDSAISDWSNAEKSGTQQQVSIRVYSRAPGRKETCSIMERITTLMHTGWLNAVGQQIVYTRFLSSQITLLDDGRTYRGSATFRCLLSEN